MASLKEHTYRIKTSLIASSVAAVLLSAVLLVQSAAYHDPAPRMAVLIVILLPFYYIFLEILSRRVIIIDRSLVKKTLFTRRVLEGSSITRAGRADVKDRTYIVVEMEGERPLLVSNSFGRFGDLTKEVVELAGEDTVTDNLKTVPRERHRRTSDLVHIWMAALVFVVIIAVRFAG
jgi:ABC-type multidrug transport system fused ATPase/permease subunit